MWNPLDPHIGQIPPWAHWHWLRSDDIPLALGDSQEDSRRTHSDPHPQWEMLTLSELERYHRQLFMWRLLQINFKLDATLGITPFGCFRD